jgi:putative phage-type endonuclease
MREPVWYPYPQGSVQWLKERCGCLTASRMAEAMEFLKGGKESEKRRKLKIELIAERMTDLMVGRFVSDAMLWGIEKEPAARSRYEEITGRLVQQCGFAIHGDIPYFGASPDGLVEADGLIEIKCPTTTTYAEWLVSGVVPEQHKPQMLAQLAVTGRKYVDFFAYDPRIKAEQHQHFLCRFEPEEKDIGKVEDAARTFLKELDDLFDTVIQKGDAA